MTSIVERVRAGLLKTNSKSSIRRLTSILDFYSSNCLEDNKPVSMLPEADNLFNLFKEILTTKNLYHKEGMGELFEFLYLGYFKTTKRQQLLAIIYQYFNDYPDYSDNNHFIFSLLLNLKFIYEDSPEEFNLFINFLARLYLKTTPVKQGIIDVVLVGDELEKMRSQLNFFSTMTDTRER